MFSDFRGKFTKNTLGLLEFESVEMFVISLLVTKKLKLLDIFLFNSILYEIIYQAHSFDPPLLSSVGFFLDIYHQPASPPAPGKFCVLSTRKTVTLYSTTTVYCTMPL